MLEGMSQPPHTQTTPPASTRWLLSLVTVSLGGYLLILSLSGQFIQLFTGMRLEISYGVLLVVQLLIALAVVVLGFVFAPAALARRLIAGGILVAVVFVVVVLQAIRLSSGFGAASVFVGFTLGDSFVMLAAALGAGWLVVRGRPALAYAALALVVVLALAHWGLLVNGVDSATTQLVMLLLGVVVVAAIGWGGVLSSRVLGGAASGSPQPYPHQPGAPQPYPHQNDRPAERGPVI
jgi:hypothetical protein